MKLAQIRAIHAVAQTGSVLGASKDLKVPRTRLRTLIRDLEADLGVRLLTHSARGVELTEDGRDFIDRSRRLLHEADELVRLTTEAGQTTLGELRIVLPTGVPPKAVQLLTGLIRARHPELALRLSTHPNPLAVIDAAVDVVVHFGEGVTSGSFRTFVMRKFALRLMASAAYLDRRGRPTSIEALQGHDLLAWVMPGQPADRLVLPGAEGLALVPWFSSTDAYVVRSAVEAGRGIALLPEALAGAGGWPGAPLELVLPDAVVRDEVVRVLLPERTATTARSRAVVEVLRELGGALEEPPRP